MTIIPKGYKKTEVGIIPNSWEVLELGAVAPYSKGRLSASLVDEYSYVSCENMRKNKGGVSFPASVPSSGSVVKYNGGDILLGNIRPYLEKIWLANKIGACSTDVLCLQPNIDSVFLFNVLSTDSFFHYVMSNVKGTKMPRGDKKHIAQYRFAAPTNQGEQHAIATTLSDMDALIEAKTALLEKKRAIKQGALQELLTGRRRLPGFAVTPMKKTDIGEIPEDWDVVNIKTVCNIDPDSLSSNTSPDFEFSYISLEGVSKGKLLNFEQKVFKLAPSRARKRPKEGDTLFGTVRPNLQSHYLFAKHAGEFVCSTGFAVLRPVSIYSNFLFQLVLSSLVSVQIDSMISGSNYPAVSSADVGNLIIPYPKEQEQRAIATVLNDMDAEISVIDEEIIKLRNLKQGMMRELLTGRIRLVK